MSELELVCRVRTTKRSESATDNDKNRSEQQQARVAREQHDGSRGGEDEDGEATREEREGLARVCVCGRARGRRRDNGPPERAALLCIFLACGGGSTALTDALARSGAAPTTATNSGPSSSTQLVHALTPGSQTLRVPCWLSLALMCR